MSPLDEALASDLHPAITIALWAVIVVGLLLAAYGMRAGR